MQITVPAMIISIVLFFVLFFGIGFLLNMVLRVTWLMTIVSPIIFVFVIDDVRFIEYFTNTGESFAQLGTKITHLGVPDIVILGSGLAGAIVSGVVIKSLRAKGYTMF